MICFLLQTDVIDTAQRGAETLGEKSDRWVMIFLILVVILGAMGIMKWAATRVDGSLKEHTALTAQLKTTMENQQDCIERNTHSHNQVGVVLTEVKSLLRDIYEPRGHDKRGDNS